MTGEVVTGVVQGAVQGAGEAMRAPVTAVTAGVGSVAASIPQSLPAVAEVASDVTKGLEALKEVALPTPSLNKPEGSAFLIAGLSTVAQNGDHHSALLMLAYGEGKGQFTETASGLPENVLRQDFIDLERLGPQAARGLTEEVAGLENVPKDAVNDPEFLANFAQAFGQDVAMQKALMKEGKLTAEEYMAGRKQMLERSAEKATKKHPSSMVEEKDLEKIKRDAAMAAIRKQMLTWKQSVMADKRLTPQAKEVALKKIDLLERKLLVKEVMRWDGVSIMTLLALASVWAQEVVSEQ